MLAPTKVLHTITSLNVGGAQIMLARYLEQLDRTAYPSTVLSMLTPGELADAVAATGTPVVSLGMKGSIPSARHVLRLGRIMRGTDHDLIHGWMYHGDVAAIAGAMLGRRRAPVIWSIHHSLNDISDEKLASRLVIRLLAKLSSSAAVICYCSRVAAAQHESIGFNPARRIVIPNGIDHEAFAIRPEFRRRLRDMIGIGEECFLVGNVARFHPMKDHLNLVRAVARLVADGVDLHAVFIGQGHENGVVANAARELGITDHITILGGRSDVAELLPGLDVFVQSSAWGEAFPLSLGEAMACGIPCVATDVGDTGWLLGDAGILVTARQAEALASGILKIARLDAEERAALGRRARQRLVENFSLGLYIARHRDLYAEVLAPFTGRKK